LFDGADAENVSVGCTKKVLRMLVKFSKSALFHNYIIRFGEEA